MKKIIPAFLFLLGFSASAFAQEMVPAVEKNADKKVTSYSGLTVYVEKLDEQSELLSVQIIGKSVENRNLYALLMSSSQFGKDKQKIRVMILAQQHGNEQSGKEGALLLAAELLKPENRYLFEIIDLAIIPQVNPDGSEQNIRRNANGADLNRNHLILSEPETIALHNFFDKYLFEVTMDVHEYSPYGEEWVKYGYRKNTDITIGTTTNINVSEKIRKLSDSSYLPFVLKYLADRKFSSFVYCPGGPPEVNYFRHSTFDINDGRQSLGIQNTMSFIQEGMNGKDGLNENLGHRAHGQMTGMRGLLEYVFRNNEKIKNLVSIERAQLKAGGSHEEVSIQSGHQPNGQKLKLPLLSLSTGFDTLVTVSDYRPVVKSLYNTKKPTGYLIPVQLQELADWCIRQSITTAPFNEADFAIGQYFVNSVDSIDFEGDLTVNPSVTLQKFSGKLIAGDYLFIPTSQLKGNMIVLALEPKSMLGLVTYKNFSHLLKKGEPYPILPVTKK